MTTQDLAIVLPVFNEAGTIVDTLREINDKIATKFNSSIFVFEDGSTDGTKELLLKAQEDMPINVISSPERKGYPRAVRQAMLYTKSDNILFMDSDGQYEPNDFERLRMRIRDADIVMGQRTRRTEPAYRTILSRGLNMMARGMFGASCHDLTSAFRLMKGPVARSLARDLRYSRYNFWS